jgi:arsenite methyltransferase
MKEFVETSYDLNDKELISVIDELSLWAAPFGLKLLEAIPIKKNIIAIDIGFGLGFPLLEAAMRLGDSCKVYGIDPWKSAVERAKFKAKIYGICNVEFLTGTAEQIPLPDKYVDLIISNNGVNNVEDLNKTFSECSRISKPGARFIFTFNLDRTMIEFYDIFEKVLSERKMVREIAFMKEHIRKKRKPLSEIKSVAELNGFNVKSLVEDEFKYRFADGTSMMNHFLIKLAFLKSWKNIVPGENEKSIFIEIENRLNKLSEDKGEIVLTIPFATCSLEKNN